MVMTRLMFTHTNATGCILPQNASPAPNLTGAQYKLPYVLLVYAGMEVWGGAFVDSPAFGGEVFSLYFSGARSRTGKPQGYVQVALGKNRHLHVVRSAMHGVHVTLSEDAMVSSSGRLSPEIVRQKATDIDNARCCHSVIRHYALGMPPVCNSLRAPRLERQTDGPSLRGGSAGHRASGGQTTKYCALRAPCACFPQINFPESNRCCPTGVATKAVLPGLRVAGLDTRIITLTKHADSRGTERGLWLRRREE